MKATRYFVLLVFLVVIMMLAACQPAATTGPIVSTGSLSIYLPAEANANTFHDEGYTDSLNILSIEGVTSDTWTVEDDIHALTRLLLTCSDAQVAAHINFHLPCTHDEIGITGYFPANQEALGASKIIQVKVMR